MNLYASFGKRMLDIMLALMLLISLSWLLLIIIIVYWLLGERTVLFHHERIGRGERIFKLHKFRTLSSDTSRPILERRFPWGNFLRFTNLDELPQCWNILKGEMSFVGPRPLPTEYLQHYTMEQKKRHTVRPGITGWAQVNGRHSISWEKKFSLDLYYVEHLSFMLDLRILVKTIVVILSFKQDRSLYEEKFTGKKR